MKKYFMTMVVMAIFAIGFAASDEDSSSSNSTSETEQKQESEVTEKKSQKEIILKYGYDRGFDYGKSLQKLNAINKEKWCKECFLNKCNTPRTEEEKAFYEEFKKQFYKGWEDAIF